jgi:hypothetical protein
VIVYKMVKNTVGGCKSKKLARKTTTSFVAKRESTRFSVNELEQYAIVSKIYGNGRCQIKTHSGLDLQCVIRNKFKGRSKRGNVVSVGTYILIGLREWETTHGFKTCDLLEIYDTEDVNILNNQSLFKTLLSFRVENKHEDDLFSADVAGIPTMLDMEKGVLIEEEIIGGDGMMGDSEFDFI